MILSDFHTHSSNSGDCDIPMHVQIESAKKKGLKYLCITEHMDLGYPDPPKGREDEFCNFVLNYDAYKNEFDAELTKTTDINLFHGVELGLQTHMAMQNKEFLQDKSFDFIIGSSHLIDGEDPYFPEYYVGKAETDVFRRYFEYIYENICAFNDFDIYGHLDYIIRYGKQKDKFYKYSDYSDEIDAILKILIENGKGLEINTGGLRNGLHYPNPCPDILKRYRELGGEIITVGSDAHVPEHIAYSFNIAEQILTDCGFRYYTMFKQRRPEFIRLN